MADVFLYDRLEDAYLRCPFSDRVYLPLNVLEREITVDVVKTEADLSMVFNVKNPGFYDNVVRRARRVFAILVIIGEPRAIEGLLKDGVCDDDLPLRRGDNDPRAKFLVAHDGRKEFRCFEKWRSAVRIRDFLEKQWIVLAPVIDTSGRHVKMDPECALPLLTNELVGNGQASVVSRSEVHPAHQRDLLMIGSNYGVAVKEFKRLEAFQQEKANLDQLRHIRNEHLIQHLATFERGPRYYVIFPWANGGSLADFWVSADGGNRTKELTLWVLQQMLGVTSAIASLHEVNCRHGDLKPENILHFRKSDAELGTLVIADVGVSRVHRQPTRLRQEGTTTRATTPAYEAPETLDVTGGPRRRRYDMWSLGCILLEFVIWILEDNQAIERFRSARDGPYFEFYRIRSNGVKVIHPVVLDAIDAIKRDTRVQGGTALEAVVDLLAEHLLLIEAESRETAEDAVARLRKIVHAAEEDPDYLMRTVDQAPEKLRFSSRPNRKDSMAFESAAETIFEEPSEV